MRTWGLVRGFLLTLLLALSIAAMYLAIVGVGNPGYPVSFVSDKARSFNDPSARYLIFPKPISPWEAQHDSVLRQRYEGLPDIAFLTGGGKLGFRRLRHGDDWTSDGRWPPSWQWNFDLLGCSIHFEKNSDCLNHPFSSYIRSGHMEL